MPTLSQFNPSSLWETIASGGYTMLALALLALVLFRNAIAAFLFVRSVQPGSLEGEALDFSSLSSFRMKVASIVKNQLRYIHILAIAAPLLGLLGTVIGMLDTFKGLSQQAGQDTARSVADGVKVALITTQTGLMIAITGVFFSQLISRSHRRQEKRIADLEIISLKQRIRP